MRLTDRLDELNQVSPEIAWKLVDTLFEQTSALVVGAAVFMLLGLIGFVGTGSFWYLGGLIASAAICGWRLWQAHVYQLFRDSALPADWARRSVRGGWASAAGWGAWSAVVLFEPEKAFVIMVIGAQSACIIGAVVRSCAVRVVADGQTFLTLTPLFVFCLVSGNTYLMIYAGFVAIHIYAALALSKFLHHQTLQLLIQDEEKSGLVGRLRAAKQDLEVANRLLENEVATDALTAVANRRAFDLGCASEWRRAARERSYMSMLLLDIDYFKAFNDFYGHQAGDACLRAIATTIAGAVSRAGDIVARYGGEEFAVILPKTDLEGAATIARKILEAVNTAAIVHDGSGLGRVTVSIGAACLLPDHQTTADHLTARADAALYTAKRNGRNRVHLAAGPMPPPGASPDLPGKAALSV